VRSPRESYQILAALAEHFPPLRPAQQRGLALWVYGTLLAHSSCQNAVVAALLALGGWHTVRQRVREWLYDGADRAAPCATSLDVTACFAPLLRWVLHWWQGAALALAVDATLHGDRVTALVVSVLYRGCALPVAWHLLPANRPGAWMPAILTLLATLAAVVPPSLTVLVLADRGLWSPRLWRALRRWGWHPLLRVQEHITFAPRGQERQAAARLVPGPGHAWVGAGVAFRQTKQRQAGTLLVVWAADQRAPWVLLTDLPPAQVGACWYGLRVWIELGFRALKGVGWQWQHTRRTDPTRVARHWLVLAVATRWVLAVGTRAEDAAARRCPVGRLRTAPPTAPRTRPRRVSVFRLGLSWLQRLLGQGRLWRRLWLLPEPWPAPLPGLQIRYHAPT